MFWWQRSHHLDTDGRGPLKTPVELLIPAIPIMAASQQSCLLGRIAIMSTGQTWMRRRATLAGVELVGERR